MKNIGQLFTPAATGNSTSPSIPLGGPCTFQASITGTGTFGATVTLYGSNANNNSGGEPLITGLALSDSKLHDGIYIPASWPFCYVVISGASGTITAINASVGV